MRDPDEYDDDLDDDDDTCAHGVPFDQDCEECEDLAGDPDDDDDGDL